MAEIGSCTTRGTHCVSCGLPHDLMAGSLSPCCEKRMTTAGTCDGRHPVYVITPGPSGPVTDADVDQVLVPLLRDVALSLVGGGRQPDQALADLDRAIDVLRAELAQEMRAHIEATGELPG
jgi:hypothetical protein